MNIKEIEEFFKLNGFKLLKNKTSNSFGDYYAIYSNEIIKFRISSSRSNFSIDISSIFENDWFDLVLLKSLITKNEKIIIKPFNEKKYLSFLVKEIDTIMQLFDQINFLKTKNKLKTLEQKRAKQMFSKYSPKTD